jgi:hypothetical protein
MGRPEPVPLAAVPSDPLSPLRDGDFGAWLRLRRRVGSLGEIACVSRSMARDARGRKDDAGISVLIARSRKDRRKMKVSRLGWKVEEVEDVSIDERSVDFDESRWKMIRKSGANQLRRLD